MPERRPGAPADTARRDVLRMLVLAPAAAAAACATAPPAAGPAAASGPAGAAGPTPEEQSAAALQAVRDVALPAEAEPAFVFRALSRRGR